MSKEMMGRIQFLLGDERYRSVGLIQESRKLASILRYNGFEVYGIACKAGVQKKLTLEFQKDVMKSEKICVILFYRRRSSMKQRRN